MYITSHKYNFINVCNFVRLIQFAQIGYILPKPNNNDGESVNTIGKPGSRVQVGD